MKKIIFLYLFLFHRIVWHISHGFPGNPAKAEAIKNKWVNVIDGLLE